ncbi:mannose-1-phosphate guanylyltransferase [Halobellus ruber]|uniref:Mannose-1-phosphate guanylyltransferase n=1 Tax=Halobellus ruber TaxID=2761102 RepID=A0A7J9SM96_9EURY|nr:sugar phosphate nucleotidyltransferase [Halobellus ruber]MBB6647166.1 mannose-1-phosphate guanylyltransferase [Halobellus ruber]
MAGPDPGSGAGPTVVAVVLAGGTGSRLYPASRSDRPKQFLSLLRSASLLERTVDRARTVADSVVVLTRESYAAGVAERVPDAEVLVEPAGRDTGPALLYATHWIGERYDDAVALVLPSDHLIGESNGETAGFAPAVRRGVAVAAETDRLVTFGVEPTRPETGYGYIEAGEAPGTVEDGVPPATDAEWYPVASFHEKPDAETAESYVAAGHYWNAGLFAWRPEVFLAAADAPPLSPLVDALRSGDDAEVAAAFESVDPVSVDYAVLESAADVAVVPAAFPWDDVGAWDALDRVLDADADGNAATEGVTLRALEAADNVVAADDAHVSVVGVSGLAVVAWDDRVLVVPKERAQDVKRLVRRLEDRGEF